MNGVLPIGGTRDLEYADLSQWDDPALARPLIEHWMADRRPIFFISDLPVTSPWPGIAVELLDARQGFYRVVKSPAPESVTPP
jgi:hypothetical protein